MLKVAFLENLTRKELEKQLYTELRTPVHVRFMVKILYNVGSSLCNVYQIWLFHVNVAIRSGGHWMMLAYVLFLCRHFIAYIKSQ